MMRVLIGALSATAAVAAYSADADVLRAHTTTPKPALCGRGHVDMVFKLNQQLVQTPGLQYAPCEAFSTQELQDLQETLFHWRDPRFQAIYEKSEDNRRLGAFGDLTSDLKHLKELWKTEQLLSSKHPVLADVTRDGKCHEVVMWWVHHLSTEVREELKPLITLPLLATGGEHTDEDTILKAPTEAVEAVMKGYKAGIGCSVCHASGAPAGNTASTIWPESLSYNATAHGAFPFWDNTGPGCVYCNPAISPSQQISVKYSAKLNAEMLLHASCGDMSWTGAANAPKSSPCNHLFNPEFGAFIYTPVSALSPEADGAFCCRTYKAKDAQFPGAVPKDWARSMVLWVNATGGVTSPGFVGDYYTGDVKYYYSGVGIQFWYIETAEGVPVEQGEGCYQPGIYPRQACPYRLPIMLYHDYDPLTFLATDHDMSEFEVPEVCRTTTVSCAAPGGDFADSEQSSQFSPVMTLHARMAGVGPN